MDDLKENINPLMLCDANLEKLPKDISSVHTIGSSLVPEFYILGLEISIELTKHGICTNFLKRAMIEIGPS